MRMLITDLDGTLLNNQGRVGLADLDTLHKLGQKKIIRVIATGRSYFSFQKVIPADFPIEYVILSSGAGLMDWQTKKIMVHHKIEIPLVRKIAGLLIQKKIDFMVHDELPANHRFFYYAPNQNNGDFKRRLEIYEPFAKQLMSVGQLSEASQFVLIFRLVEEFTEDIRNKLNDVHIIRATSPLDKQSVWFELMPKGVSKRSAAEQLARQFNIAAKDILALGNDYNDLGLLDWAGQSFVVANAPSELKMRFDQTVSNEENALTQVLKDFKSHPDGFYSPTLGS